MKKLIGIEAEVNITVDEAVAQGIGKGISKGSITLTDIIKEIKLEIIRSVKQKFIEEKHKKK